MYNNPFFYGPASSIPATARAGVSGMGGLLGRASAIRQGINWSGILTGTQKTLGVINQVIPIVYQVKPIINNARTMFRIVGAVRNEKPNRKSESISVSNTVTTTHSNDNKPVFFL